MYVFSSMTRPTRPATATDVDMDRHLVEKVELATFAGWAERFYIQIGNGHYYSGARVSKFDPTESVDAYLLDNLAAVRDGLVRDGLDFRRAHAFLGRLLFTCYLCDRGIIELSNYFKGKSWQHIHELLEAFEDPGPALYQTLFPALKRDFNGSMFDDELADESGRIKPAHFHVIRRFLLGDDIAKGHGQRSLGFRAYDFKFIPIETISAIYENFLEEEGRQGQTHSGPSIPRAFSRRWRLDLALNGAPAPYSQRHVASSIRHVVLAFSWCCCLIVSLRSGELRQKMTQSPQARAEALLDRLGRLCGVDKIRRPVA